jgi:hypothetical protein
MSTEDWRKFTGSGSIELNILPWQTVTCGTKTKSGAVTAVSFSVEDKKRREKASPLANMLRVPTFVVVPGKRSDED